MISITAEVSTAVNLPVYNVSTGLLLAGFSFTVHKDGVTDSTVPVITEPTPTFYNAEFTFPIIGSYSVFEGTTLIAHVRVTDKDLFSMLQDVEDQAIGSWQWDKQTGTLVMLRQDTTTLATFDVIEDANVASRSRT